MASHLVAILHSRPVSSGAATLRRVDIARRALHCDAAVVANLVAARLTDVNALNTSTEFEAWARGRDDIQRALDESGTTDVLLGYGVQQPSGDQRIMFRNQIEWLAAQLEDRRLRVWAFGGRPTHPSRWQRVVYRHMPGGSVEDLASILLLPCSLRADGVNDLAVGLST